jgi:hypothetical protein
LLGTSVDLLDGGTTAFHSKADHLRRDNKMRLLPQTLINHVNKLPTTSVGFPVFAVSYVSHWIFRWPDLDTSGFLFVLIFLDGLAQEVDKIGDELFAIGCLLNKSTSRSDVPFWQWQAQGGRKHLDARVCGFYILMTMLFLQGWLLPDRKILDTLSMFGCWLFFSFAESTGHILERLRVITKALHRTVLK